MYMHVYMQVCMCMHACEYIGCVHVCVGPINIWCCAQPLSTPFLEAIHSLTLKPKAP